MDTSSSLTNSEKRGAAVSEAERGRARISNRAGGGAFTKGGVSCTVESVHSHMPRQEGENNMPRQEGEKSRPWPSFSNLSLPR